MIKRALYIPIFVAILILVGCSQINGGTAGEIFVRDATAYGVWVGGRQVIVKADNLHQDSRRGKSYRIQTDDQAIYVNILLNLVPDLVGDKCTATITSRGLTDIGNDAFNMVLQKRQGDKMWLWNESNKIGIVIPVLR